MGEIEFNEGEEFRKRLTVKPSAVNIFIKKYSFGTIHTDTGAEMVKVGIIVIAIIWVSAVYTLTAPSVQLPSPELINSPQPTRPLP